MWVRRRNVRKRRKEDVGIQGQVYILESLWEAVSVMEHQRTRENRDEAVYSVTWIKGFLRAASSRNVREC